MNKKKYTYIDIGKDSLEVKTPRESFRIANDNRGFAALRRRSAHVESPLMIFEATGGYERPLMSYLFSKHIALARVNPARVRAFARSEGIKAKTDPIDAKMLLRFAEEKKPDAAQAPDPARERLADLLDRRRHLTEQLAREKNRLQKTPQVTRRSIERMIKILEKEISRTDQQIEKLIESNPKLEAQSRTIQSVKGIGPITAWTFLAYLPEIDHIKRNKLVALVGVAPFNKDSATISKKRSIYAGRAKVRRCLYMAAQSAAIHNPVIKAYVDGLRARGKPYKCAIVAAMRKLLIHIQSLLKNPQICLAS